MRTYTLFLALMLYALLGNTINAQDVDSIIDARDGQIYTIVKIGEQWWMAENLNIGKRINAITTASDNDTIEKYSYSNLEVYADTFGGLYEWKEAMGYDTTEGTQGICPNGWHIPTDNEFMTLEIELGMSPVDAATMGYRGTNQGTQLQENGTSGFEGKLAGYRDANSFKQLHNYAYYWTSTLSAPSSAKQRFLLNGNSQVGRFNNYQTMGCCIRCLADSGFSVPVELHSFKATVAEDGVFLTWQTASEDNNLGFNILRSITEYGSFDKINDAIIPGYGTTSLPQSYSYTDHELTPGIWYYKIEQVDFNGVKDYSPTVTLEYSIASMNDILLINMYDNSNNKDNLFNINGSLSTGSGSGIYLIRDGNKFKKLLIVK